MRRCELCGTSVPVSGWQQHVHGRRHQSMRFYGQPDHLVLDLSLADPVQPQYPRPTNIRMRPVDVPERIVACARRARELVITSRVLVAHTGLALFDKACQYLSPECICTCLYQFDKQDAMHRERPLLRADVDLTDPLSTANPAATVAAAAALIACNSLSAGAPRELHEIELLVRSPLADLENDPVREAALAAALTAFAEALPHLRAGRQQVTMRLPGVVQRRHVVLIVRALERALFASTGLSELILLQAGILRDEDIARLSDASWRGWHARELCVLRGTHAHGDSPLRLLPEHIVRHILDLAAETCRVRLHIDLGHGGQQAQAGAASSAAAPQPVPPPASHAGADLAFVANLF